MEKLKLRKISQSSKPKKIIISFLQIVKHIFPWFIKSCVGASRLIYSRSSCQCLWDESSVFGNMWSSLSCSHFQWLAEFIFNIVIVIAISLFISIHWFCTKFTKGSLVFTWTNFTIFKRNTKQYFLELYYIFLSISFYIRIFKSSILSFLLLPIYNISLSW